MRYHEHIRREQWNVVDNPDESFERYVPLTFGVSRLKGKGATGIDGDTEVSGACRALGVS